MKQKGKNWIDANGKEVPVYAIKDVMKVEEKQSHKIATLALKAEKALKELMHESSKAYNSVYDAKIKDAEFRGNKRPSEGMTISSFDNSIEVKFTKPDILYFDNTYTSLVKEKFDEYFSSLNAGNETAEFLRDIVNELLFTSGGKLDNGKVLQLRQYRDRINASAKLRIKGMPFVQAVDLFDKAIKKKPGNTGLYVSISDTPGGKKRRIALKYTDV